ncbi:hypothetical protein [Alteribacter natronophilus]|uniref:hypothetical protein n=1 Tax=Alteribacter natronophilus TaxID=2583810 RepID=UPI00110D5870|nr:hypothetical protein [Alteribacter natronophilus]TMW70672.1 hypothetical protein FGB90_15940 [Alteribacter natronophilus]
MNGPGMDVELIPPWSEKPAKKLKREFKQKKLPLLPVVQSLPVTVDGVRYVAVGSARDGACYFTMFEVYTEAGEQVENRHTAETVHRRLSVYYLSYMLSLAAERHERVILSSSSSDRLRANLEVSFPEKTDVIEAFERLHQGQGSYNYAKASEIRSAAERISDSYEIGGRDGEILEQYFADMEEDLIARMKLLYRLPAYHADDMGRDEDFRVWMKNVSEEIVHTRTMIHLFSDLVEGDVSGSGSFPSIVESHYLYHKCQEPHSPVRLTNTESRVYGIFKLLMELSKKVIIPLCIILFFVTGFNFFTLIYPSLFFLLYYPVYKGMVSRLSLNTRQRYGEYARQINPDRGQTGMREFTVTGNSISESAFFLIVAGAFLTYPFINVYLQDNPWTSFERNLIIIGIIIVVFSYSYPYMRMSRRKIVFKDEYVVYNKDRQWPHEMKLIHWNPAGKTLKINVRGDTEFIFSLTSTEAEKVIPKVETWAERNRVPFVNSEK